MYRFLIVSMLVVAGTTISLLAGTGHDGLDGMIRNAIAAENVNCRYTVERVVVSGFNSQAISRVTRRKLDAMAGQKLNAADVEALAARIRLELHNQQVHVRITKGSHMEQVSVAIEIERDRKPVDFNVSRLGFQSGEGVTGSSGVRAEFRGNVAEATVLNDADSLLERDRGFTAMFEREHIDGTNPIGVRVSYGAMSPNWSGQTIAATAGGIVPYRSRQFVEPEVIVTLAKGLQISAGVSVEQLNGVSNQAGRTESANAAIATLHYARNWQGNDVDTQAVEAAYGMRAGTASLGGNYSYSRHSTIVSYTFRHMKQSLKFTWLAGLVNGTAPLYDKFALGNSTTLRGWNKYDLAPLGGSRMVHGSVEYQYRMLEAFYDTGSIWDRGQNHSTKHSVGVGIRKDAMQLAVAFPLRNGHIEPVIIAGVNF